jgi:hypothetical protein
MFPISFASHGQILISLLLGDKLNSENIEFGLDGGLNLSTLNNLNEASHKPGFNLGFYFDLKTKSKWILHPGLIVKSPMGTKGLTPYLLNDPNLDQLFNNGEVTRKLRYLSPYFLLKHPLFNQFYAEGGIQLGWLTGATDVFQQKINNPEDLVFKNEIKNEVNKLDAGPVIGIGYRLMKGQGMNLGIRYYYGLVNVSSGSSTEYYNRSIYFAVGIPIGAKSVDK